MNHEAPSSNTSTRGAMPRKVYRTRDGLPTTVDLGELGARRSYVFRFPIEAEETFHIDQGSKELVFREGDACFHASPDGSRVRHEVTIRVTAGEPGPFSDSLWLSRAGRPEHPIKITGQVLEPEDVPSSSGSPGPRRSRRKVLAAASFLPVIAVGGWYLTPDHSRATAPRPEETKTALGKAEAGSVPTVPPPTGTGPAITPPNKISPTVPAVASKGSTETNPTDTAPAGSTPTETPSPVTISVEMPARDLGSAGKISAEKPPEGTDTHEAPLPEPVAVEVSRLPKVIVGKDWGQGSVVVVLVLTRMTEADRNLIGNQIAEIREKYRGLLAANDVFVIGREEVWPSRDWPSSPLNRGAFETGPRGFVESFTQVAADLNEIDRWRPGNPARRVVLWHSASCPSTLAPGELPTIDRAQVVWSGAEIKENGEILDQVFGKKERVNPVGPSLENLTSTLESVLKSSKTIGEGH